MSALREAEPVRAVVAALGDEKAWLVGGVVRDARMGRPLRDVDVAVAGDPAAAAAAARRAARALSGPVFALSEAFGAWRAMDGARRFTCDFSPLQGATIEADLARRDFTVNAMAVPIAGGPTIDPHGGEADLARGRLRVLGASAYERDPLRVLRAVRLVAELGLRPDAETERLTAAAAPGLDRPSPERVFAELRRLVVAPAVLDGLALAARLGVLAATLPELSDLEGVEQSRFHHLDAFDHTIEALRRLIEIEDDLGALFGDLAPRIATVLEEPLADELTRGEALRFAALLHDVGKPGTRGVRADGRVTFVGHDAEGEEMVRRILRRLRASERLRSFVGKLTREHLAPGFLVDGRPVERRAVHAFLRRCEPVEVEVILLSCADRLATRGAVRPGAISAHLEVAREMMPAALEWREHGPPRPPLRGDELADEMGMEPGPQLGELLAALEQAAYAGEAATRAQALALARRLRQNQRR